MDRVLAVCIIHKANDALRTLRNDDGRAGAFAIVADEASGFELRIYLLSERLDLKFVIPDLLSSDRIGNLPIES